MLYTFFIRNTGCATRMIIKEWQCYKQNQTLEIKRNIPDLSHLDLLLPILSVYMLLAPLHMSCSNLHLTI